MPPANTLVRWVDEIAFASVVQARPCPTFGRPVRHGVAPSTTARYCSANPSDPTSRWAPCPPQFRRGGSRSTLAVSSFRLRARVGVSIPATCGRRGITPAFGYGPPHPGAGGTSTLLTSALPGAQYVLLRHPGRPDLALTGRRLARATPPAGLPVLRPFPSSMHGAANTPAETVGACVARFPTAGSLPRMIGGSASAALVSTPARRSLALRPAWSLSRPRRPFFIGVLQPTSLPPSSAPTATGWSDGVDASPGRHRNVPRWMCRDTTHRGDGPRGSAPHRRRKCPRSRHRSRWRPRPRRSIRSATRRRSSPRRTDRSCRSCRGSHSGRSLQPPALRDTRRGTRPRRRHERDQRLRRHLGRARRR